MIEPSERERHQPVLVIVECAGPTVTDGAAHTRLSDQELEDLLLATATPDIVEPAGTVPPADLANRRIVANQPVLAVAGAGDLHCFTDQYRCWVRLGADHRRVSRAVLRTDDPAVLGDQLGLDAPAVASIIGELAAIGLVRLDPVVAAPEPTLPTVDEPPVDPEPAVALAAAGPWRSVLDRTSHLSTRLRATLGRRGHRDPAPSAAPPPEDRKVPVYSFWATDAGPHLGSAAVVSYARVFEDGRLNDIYDFRRAAPARDVLAEIAAGTGPAVLLCSNYVWSIDANLEVARNAIASNPAVVVVHGGPSTPRYDADCEQFLRGLDGQHVAVNGEGEVTFAESLAAIGPRLRDRRTPVLDALRGVAGVRFVDPVGGDVVKNPDRPRHDELADFPSPLSSGELDDVDPEVLATSPLPVETNRGCPYGCTFCDWGQATMTRVRKFPLERVVHDFEWLAQRNVALWVLADANFGMLPRDADISKVIVEIRDRTGFPEWMAVAPPKNTTKRFVAIVDRLLGSGIATKTSLALQTRDAGTLEAIRRSNIGTTAYDELAVRLRRRGLPLTCDLMVGLPGATVQSFKEDLQWCVDQQARAFLFPTFVLPNAPMNDPDYRAEFGIKTHDGGLVSETASFKPADRARMERLGYAYVLFEGLGLLRHVLRHLQWDHGRRVMDVVEQILDVVEADPAGYPLVAWQLQHADVVLVPSVGWKPFYEEVRRLLVDEIGIPDDTGLETALAVNRFVMPWPGRTFPDTLEVPHDYVAYFTEARRSLLETSTPGPPSRPLREFPPGSLEVAGDPDDRCRDGLARLEAERPSEGFIGDFWITTHIELLSPILSMMPLSPSFIREAREQGYGPEVLEEPDEEPVSREVTLLAAPRRR